jgi:hypothetical protein
MFNYAAMTTTELIDLLFKEEDRVRVEHAGEIIKRGEEAAALLREILINEDYWYEGQGGNYWIAVHAVALLGAMRDEKALPDLIEMVQHAYFANHEDGIAIYGMALGNFGEMAVEPLMAKIREYRGWYWDNNDFGQCRYTFSNALTRIAFKNEGVRQRVLGFLCEHFEDPRENDAAFLSFSAGHPIALNRDRGLKAVRVAYNRGVIIEGIAGKYKDMVIEANKLHPKLFIDLQPELLDFYTPEAIAERAQQRAQKKEEKLYWNTADAAAPAGYRFAERGGLVRTEKVGRNDPCPCGSGKKYKKCCGQ